MPIEASARHIYKKDKEKIEKKSRHRHENLTEEEKKIESKNMVVDDIKISLKNKITVKSKI